MQKHGLFAEHTQQGDTTIATAMMMVTSARFELAITAVKGRCLSQFD